MEKIIQNNAFDGHIRSFIELFFQQGINLGRFGVAIFFLISGFVIPFSFRGQRPLISFALGRIFRLYPAYWSSLLFALFVFSITGKMWPNAKEIIGNITMFQTFVGISDIVGAYWTLAIEWIFYSLCAALYWKGWLTNSRFLFLCIISLMISALALGGTSILLARHLPSGVPLHLALMFLGTIIRCGWQYGDPLARKLIPLLLPLMMIVIPVIQWSNQLYRPEGNEFLQPLAFTIAYYLAIGLFLLTIVRPINTGKLSIWFGTISFSVYVFHGPMMDLSYFFVRPDNPINAIRFFVLTLTGTIIISSMIYRFIERPSIEFGHKMTNKFRR